MKKCFKILSIFLIFIAIFSFGTHIFASDVNSSLAEKKANSFLNSLGGKHKINNPIILKDLNDNNTAVSFSIDDKGYIIIDLKNLSVVEMSLDNNNPFLNIKNPIFNGPLNYYQKTKKGFLSLKDDSLLQKNEFKIVYGETKNVPKRTDENIYYPFASTNTVKVLSGSLKKWYIDGNNCGSIASAITMRYYYDNVNKKYVDSNKISENSLIALMQHYVGAGKTTYPQVVNGLNNYFTSRKLNNFARAERGFNFNKLQNRIYNNRPVIIGTDNDQKYGNHWIIGHGYAIIRDSVTTTNYAIVNDGWRHNNIWINIKASSLDGLIYFSD